MQALFAFLTAHSAGVFVESGAYPDEHQKLWDGFQTTETVYSG